MQFAIGHMVSSEGSRGAKKIKTHHALAAYKISRVISTISEFMERQ